VNREPAEGAGARALRGPGELRREAKEREAGVGGPELREPEAAVFAGAAHAGSGFRRVAVKLRVQRGVIIHFELEVDGERSAARGDVGEKVGEAGGEVGALDADAGEFFGALGTVPGRGVGADGFLVHVKFLEREDGEAVDHHAGGFGVARAAGGGRLERGDDVLVHRLDEIVSLLVETVDVALGAIDGFEAEVVAAGDVLLVPELEIAQVVLLDEEIEAVAGGGGGGLVPAGSERGLEGGDVGGGKSHRRAEGN